MQSFAKAPQSAKHTSGPQRRQAATRSLLRASQRLNRAACACGGTCPHCRGEPRAAANLQPKLTVNQPGDAFEQEADRVAEQVMRMADPNPPAAAKPVSMGRLQRRADDPHGAATAPPIVHDVLRSSGQSLDASTRAFMEPRFGRDFGDVRVHVGDKSDQSAKAVRALAYTVGRDIVFAAGNYKTGTTDGRRLLAHELTHTMQQAGGKSYERASTAPDVQSQPVQVARQDGGVGGADAGTEEIHDAGEIPLPGGVPEQPEPPPPEMQEPAPQPQPVQPPRTQQPLQPGLAWANCPGKRGGNPSLRLAGFDGTTAGTHISDIQVDIHANNFTNVTLTWQNLSLSPGTTPPTSLNASPGAGICRTDCSDNCNSQVNGSHCTSLSPPTFQVQGYGCYLGSSPKATFVTWFNYTRGIAFHYFDVPNHPESHGCVRMERDPRGAEWIFDNTLAGITNVTVNRNTAEGPGPKCWRGGALVDRPSSAPTGPVGSCAPAPTPPTGGPTRHGRGH